MVAKDRKPELLAPAGTIQAGLAAIDAGADAVYTGLPRFNARERGQNCTFEEYAKLLGYAHRHGCKVYVTLNTLIKERELAEVIEVLSDLLVARPDAVIVQDLGLLYLLRKYFPELTPHASTQMGIHNSAGVRAAERLGARRVILQRQVTYEEIAAIRENSSLELEVFVHGALCTGRSGSCLFSSWMGGWSGNRGRCKQPCRRRYFSEDGNGFFFSPKDLYSLEDLPRLIEMGISSLKIEGRLRRADYVSNTVEAYRMMLDAPPDERRALLGEAKRILARAPGRKWTGAFLDENAFSDVIRHKSLGTSGRLAGTVISAGKGFFTVKLSAALYLHDTIRVQPRSGDEGPGLTVTRMSVNGRDARKGAAGQSVRIACDKPVEAGAMIFRTGSQVADAGKRIEKLPVPGAVVDLEVEVGSAGVRIYLPVLEKQFEFGLETQPARRHALSAEEVAGVFRGGDEVFEAGRIAVEVEDGLFVPASRLKALRREFRERLRQEVSPEEVRVRYRARLAGITHELMSNRPDGFGEGQAETVVLARYGEVLPVKGAVAAHAVAEAGEATEEAVLPEFCAEGDLAELRRQVARALELGIRRWRVTSLYGLEVLREAGAEGLRITASYALPVCNSFAFRGLAAEYGVQKAAAWVELGRDEINDLLAVLGHAGEVVSYARLPLLTTRMEIPAEGKIRDARGAGFIVRKSGRLTVLLPEKVFAIEPPAGVDRFVDLTYAKYGERAVSEFNYPRELV